MEKTSKSNRPLSVAVLLLAFLLPFSFAIKGNDWAVAMHPDESAVRLMMESFAKKLCAEKEYGTYSREGPRVYPQGFFVFADIYRRVSAPIKSLSHKLAQEGGRHRDLDAIRAPQKKENAPTIIIGRRTNAILAGLCGLFLFLAVRAATGSAAGGLCASALAACSPFVIEHAHYCESDTAFCVGLALSLWVLFAAMRRSSLAWAVGGGAACAFALACKYTVAPLIPFGVLVFLSLCLKRCRAAQTAGARRAACWRCVLAALLFLLATLAAYSLFTPMVLVDSKLFFRKIFTSYASVQEEAAAFDLAGEGSIHHLLFWTVLHGLLGHLKEMGPLHIVLASASFLFLLLRSRKNQCGPWLFVLLLLFAALDLSVLPWVRSQEFLPFAIILGTASALAVGELCSMARTSRFAAVRFAVPAICLAGCLTLAYGDAHRATAMFSTEDSRNTMRHWLEQSSNPATRFAAGRFGSPALRGGRINTAETFGNAERVWEPNFAATNAPSHEYHVRQTRFLGRGFTDAVTGERTPYWQAGWTNFLSHAILLREWKFIPGYQTTFSMLPMELWGIVPEDATFGVPVPLAPRATAYRMGPEHYDAAQGGDWLGPIEAIRTVGARKGVRFVPPPDGSPLYAVTRHAEGLVPAKIKWEGCFEPREKVIAPGAADWFLYKPSLLDGWGDIYVRTRVRMRGDDQTSLCLTTITSDPAYAAEHLARGGSPEKAAELLAAAGLPPDVGGAVAKTVRPLPDRFFSDFARIRFEDFTVYPEPVPESGRWGRHKIRKPGLKKLESEFPVLFDPGTYRVTFRVPPQEEGFSELKSVFFTKAASQRVLSGAEFRHGEPVEIELVFDRPACPHICGTAWSNGEDIIAVTLKQFTITWGPTLNFVQR